MDERALKVLQREVTRQCEFALIAAQELDKAERGLNDIERGWEEFEHTPMSPEELPGRLQEYMVHTSSSMKEHSTQLWYSVQSLLVAVGNISKLLWPSDRRNRGKPLIPERGPELRDSLSIGVDSLLRNRDFRNYFEHFDERIEKWAVSSPSRGFADSTIASGGNVAVGDPQDNFRGYNVEQKTLMFGEESYPLQEVIDEVQALLQRTRQALGEV